MTPLQVLKLWLFPQARSKCKCRTSVPVQHLVIRGSSFALWKERALHVKKLSTLHCFLILSISLKIHESQSCMLLADHGEIYRHSIRY